MKRLFDFILALILLILISPILLIFSILIFLQDFNNPIYMGSRVGLNSKEFKMIKLRSMVVGADKSGVDSTSSSDNRITLIGRIVRQFKIDELMQLLNVIKGEMSFVGPRPQVRRDVEIYTEKELNLLSVRPGITDFSSIVFADEGEILLGKDDPDLSYNQLIRPWKSRLGLIYIDKRTLLLDIKLIFFTVISILRREKALTLITKELNNLGVNPELIKVCKRKQTLTPYPPPGTRKIVETRESSILN